jgi:hypothetical protein
MTVEKDFEQALHDLVGLDFRDYWSLDTPLDDAHPHYYWLSLQFGRTRDKIDKKGYQLTPRIWRILYNSKPVCAYYGGKNHDKRLYHNLNLIRGHFVTDISLTKETWKLSIQFDNGYILDTYRINYFKEFFFHRGTIYDDKHYIGDMFYFFNGEVVSSTHGSS